MWISVSDGVLPRFHNVGPQEPFYTIRQAPLPERGLAAKLGLRLGMAYKRRHSPRQSAAPLSYCPIADRVGELRRSVTPPGKRRSAALPRRRVGACPGSGWTHLHKAESLPQYHTPVRGWWTNSQSA